MRPDQDDEVMSWQDRTTTRAGNDDQVEQGTVLDGERDGEQVAELVAK